MYEKMAAVLALALLTLLLRVAPAAAGASDLKELKEVRSGLGHAQNAVEDLVVFLNQFLDLTTMEDTTDSHTASTVSPPLTTSTTTTTTPEPTTTTTTIPEPTTTTTTTTEPTTTTTTTPEPTTTTTTTTPEPTTTATTTATTTTITPETTTIATTTITPEPTTTAPEPTTITPGSTDELSKSPISGVLRVAQLGLQGYRQALMDGGTLRGPRGATARDLTPPLRFQERLWKGGEKLNGAKEENKIEEEKDYVVDDTTEQVDYSDDTETTHLVTLGPWWSRVNLCLDNIDTLSLEVLEGAKDHSHALLLDQQAKTMLVLVKEGEEKPEEVEDGFWGNYDEKQINEVLYSLGNSTSLVDQKIEVAKDDLTEMIVTITTLSVLFVVVLVALTFALIKPGSKKSGLSKSQSTRKGENETVAKESSRQFSEAKFVQHVHVHADPYKSHTSRV